MDYFTFRLYWQAQLARILQEEAEARQEGRQPDSGGRDETARHPDGTGPALPDKAAIRIELERFRARQRPREPARAELVPWSPLAWVQTAECRR